jgi:hypothetical protein
VFLMEGEVKTCNSRLQNRANFLVQPGCDKKTDCGVIWVEKRWFKGLLCHI